MDPETPLRRPQTHRRCDMNIIKPKWNWRRPPENNPLEPKDIEYIALHHMAHPTASYQEIEKWHLARDGGTWKGFGYNWWIPFEGDVIEGRGWNAGAGVLNYNSKCLSIGFQGMYEKSTKHKPNTHMPVSQYVLGVEFLKWLVPQCPNLKAIVGHRDLQPDTSCPGDYFPLQQMILDVMAPNGTIRNIQPWETEGEQYLFEHGYITSRHDPRETVDYGELGRILRNYDRIRGAK